MLGCGVVVRVLDDSLADFEGQIQPAKLGIAELEVLDDAQCLQVVVEEVVMAAHGGVQRPLARVSERRMANIVHQREGFHQINIQMERGRDGARDLCNLDGVRQTGAKVVRVAPCEDLRFVLQAAECPGMDDAVTVALERVAVGVRRLRIAPSARLLHAKRVAGEHELSVPIISFEFRVSSFEKDKSNHGLARMTRFKAGELKSPALPKKRRQNGAPCGLVNQFEASSIEWGGSIPPFPKVGKG